MYSEHIHEVQTIINGLIGWINGLDYLIILLKNLYSITYSYSYKSELSNSPTHQNHNKKVLLFVLNNIIILYARQKKFEFCM